MPVLFNSISLPAYALVDDAFPQIVKIADNGLGGSSAYTAGGHYIDVPVLFQVTLTTSAAVATRTVQVLILDGDGNSIALHPAPATQTASLIINYQFDAAVPFAYGPVGRSAVAPLPQVALLPGWSFIPRVDILGAGDTWAGLTLSIVRIPTGQVGPEPVVPDLIPTPIAL